MIIIIVILIYLFKINVMEKRLLIRLTYGFCYHFIINVPRETLIIQTYVRILFPGK